MKARTKYQKQVETANNALPPYQGKAVKWAYEHCATHYGYRLSSGRTTCMECGYQWQTEDSKNVRCPKCERHLTISETTVRKNKQYLYFCVLTTFRGLQLQRIFKLTVKLRKCHPADYFAEEVVRYWLNDKGQVAVTAKARLMSWYYEALSMCSDIELRRDNNVYRWMSNCYVYPRCNFLPILKRNGVTSHLPNLVSPLTLMEKVLTDSRIETMLKAGRLSDLNYFLSRGAGDLSRYWSAYKITLRNNYIIPDTNIWCDLVRLLGDCGKDIHNAYYVCPSDLFAAHNHYLSIKKETDRKRQSEIQRRKAIENEAAFEKAKSKFFGIHFTDGLIMVSVLDSVEAYYEEGEAMHHCVGTMEYFKHADSLVLSARIDGVRIETVEVSLNTFKVIQSRGVCNKNTEFHDRIIGLVESNMNLIRKAI